MGSKYFDLNSMATFCDITTYIEKSKKREKIGEKQEEEKRHTYTCDVRCTKRTLLLWHLTVISAKRNINLRSRMRIDVLQG